MSELAVLVGESNPYGGDPRYALYPEPERSAGGRLCRVVLGLTVKEYIRHFRRVNLLTSARWSAPLARQSARRLVDVAAVDGVPLVLLGAKVCAAFGVDYDPGSTGMASVLFEREWRFAVLPHPSGLSRAWNVVGAVCRARAAVRTVLGGGGGAPHLIRCSCQVLPP